jgi:hypothetical protein
VASLDKAELFNGPFIGLLPKARERIGGFKHSTSNPCSSVPSVAEYTLPRETTSRLREGSPLFDVSAD